MWHSRMEPPVHSNVRIKREEDPVECFLGDCYEKERYKNKTDHLDSESCCSPYSRGSSSPDRDGQGQGGPQCMELTKDHVVNHSPNFDSTAEGVFLPHKQVRLRPLQDAVRIPSSESNSQVTATLLNSNNCRRRKRSLPSRSHNVEYLYTDDHLARPPRSLSTSPQTYVANQVNTWPPYPNPAPTNFQPTPVIGKAFHVHSFTPGPMEQIIVRQPEEAFEISLGNKVRPETGLENFDDHVEEAPRTDSGFSDDAGSKCNGVNGCGSAIFMETNGVIFSGNTDEIEEQRQWSQVHWYRDLKKSHSLHSRDQNTTEQSIFMRCNELKQQRKREAQSMAKRKTAWEALQHCMVTPLTQHSRCTNSASSDSDEEGTSPKRQQHSSLEQSDSPADEKGRELNGWSEQRLAYNTREHHTSIGRSYYSHSSHQSCEIPKEHFVTEDDEVKSSSQKKGKDDTSSSESTQHSLKGAQNSSLKWTPPKTAKRSSPRGTSTGNNEVVCQVNGLFALPGFKDTKYNITLDELQRRIGLPENLNRVEMISYVRQAKSSGRTLLDKYHVVTSSRSNPSILSRVCEGEARVLAEGIHEINTHYLPMQSLAAKTVQEFSKKECDGNQADYGFKLRRRAVDIEITRNVLKEMRDALADHHDGGHLENLELASHGFGVPNLSNHLNLLDSYFDTLMKHLQDAVGKYAR